MNKFFIITILLVISIQLFAQDLQNDIININYEKKSLKKAALLSALFPGAGQFYANPKGITTYIFPLIEIGLIAGYVYYNDQGKKIERKYEKYANKEIIGYIEEDGVNIAPIYRYDRERFNNVIEALQLASGNPFYDEHFNLDETDTQHFYEDIGKYNKYIFGWADWYDIYAADENGNFVDEMNWLWFEEEQGLKWAGNDPTNPNSEYYIGNESDYDDPRGKYSEMRNDYIVRRKDAEDNYKNGDLCSFGLVFNHIFSAIDAIRVTKNYNSGYISQNKIKVKFGPLFADNSIYPALFVTKRF